tara:strand:+ start:238 stop:1215 length:978 start_codon:yes stop_codon:yes gene_type:complete
MPETFDNYLARQRRNASLTNPGLFPEEYQLEEGEQPWGTPGERAQRGIDRRVDRGNATADWLAWVNQDGDPYKRRERLRQVPSVDAWQNMDYAQAQHVKNWKSHNRGLEKDLIDPIDLPVMLMSGGAPVLARTAVGKTLLSKGSRVLAPRPTATTGVVGALNRFAKHPVTKWAQDVPKMTGGEIGARLGARDFGELVGKYTPLAIAMATGWGGLQWLKPANAVVEKMEDSPDKSFLQDYINVVSGDPSTVGEGLAGLEKKYDMSKLSEDSQERLRKAIEFFDGRQPRVVPVSQPAVNQVETPPPLPLPIQQQAGGFNPYGPQERV